jgi:hypothetical protein
LVKDDAGVSKAYYPDQLELLDGNRCPEEPAPTCPTPGKLREAIEIVERLMSRTRNGSRLVRLHSLLSSALSDFFTEESDSAEPVAAVEPHLQRRLDDLADEVMTLGAEPPFPAE